MLTVVDDEPYRRQIKGMRNNECRHDLARHLFHGRRGELHRAYHKGMEDQLGALGLVLTTPVRKGAHNPRWAPSAVPSPERPGP